MLWRQQCRAGVFPAAGPLQRLHIPGKIKLAIDNVVFPVFLAHVLHGGGDGLEKALGKIVVVWNNDLGPDGGGQGGELLKVLLGADMHQGEVRVKPGQPVLLIRRGHAGPDQNAGAVRGGEQVIDQFQVAEPHHAVKAAVRPGKVLAAGAVPAGGFGMPAGKALDGQIVKLVQKALGDEKPISCRPADLLETGFEKAKAEIGELARTDEDVLTYALFPTTAVDFLKKKYGVE